MEGYGVAELIPLRTASRRQAEALPADPTVHVLSLTSDTHDPASLDFGWGAVRRIALWDTADAQPEAARAIADALVEAVAQQAPLLVHCEMGVSRSVAVAQAASAVLPVAHVNPAPGQRGNPDVRRQVIQALHARTATTPRCPYCGAAAVLIPSPRPDWAAKWVCKPCDARVGCHPGTTKALGTLADAPLRDARTAAHDVFDQLWKEAGLSRRQAYRWLQQATARPEYACHIAWMDAAECHRVQALASAHYLRLMALPPKARRVYAP